MDFRNKVVLVTGASRGIGASLARAFAQEGALVVINYRQDQAAADTVAAQCVTAGGDGWALQADVTDAVAVTRMVEQIALETGRIDVVVNNAFHPYRFDPDRRQRFQDLDWDHFRSQLDGSLQGACHVCKAVLPIMKQQAGGSIVNIVSDLVEHPVVPYPDYATAKAALTGFSRHLAAELGPYGIRVNCVAPGLVWPTDASRDTRAAIREDIAAATPLRRVATPDDVAGPVLFLASDWARFMTGQTLLVDGGLVMR